MKIDAGKLGRRPAESADEFLNAMFSSPGPPEQPPEVSAVPTASPTAAAVGAASPSLLSMQTATFQDLPADLLDEMVQPFNMYDEDDTEAMRQSISRNGILQRLIVRPHEGRYQIIAGRNRRRCAILAGFTMLPCEIRRLDDDEARLQMLETNLRQRERLSLKEKVLAYRERLDIMNRQGQRTDLTSRQSDAKLRSSEILSETLPESARTIQRYVRLSYLIPDLLNAVDSGKLGLGPGETLSYLSEKKQTALEQFWREHPTPINQVQADRLRAAADVGPLTEEQIDSILSCDKKPSQPTKVSVKPFKKLFPKHTPTSVIEKTLIAAIKMYFEAGNEVIEE